MFTEGLNIFSRKAPRQIVGSTLIDSKIREESGCTVISINRKGEQIVNPAPHSKIEDNDEIILIGTPEAEEKFVETFIK